MPRKRGRKRNKKPDKVVVDSRVEVKKNKNLDIKSDYPPDFASYGMNILHDFTKAREDIIIVCYRVPMDHLTKEDVVAHYRSKMIDALQGYGKRNGFVLSPQHITFDALPLGHEVMIKAWADIKNIKGTGKLPRKLRRAQESQDPFDWGVKTEVK